MNQLQVSHMDANLAWVVSSRYKRSLYVRACMIIRAQRGPVWIFNSEKALCTFFIWQSSDDSRVPT